MYSEPAEVVARPTYVDATNVKSTLVVVEHDPRLALVAFGDDGVVAQDQRQRV